MDWLIYALLSALFAGLVAVFGKIGVRGVDSTLATAVRAVIMALALAGLVLAKSAGGGLYVSNLRLIAARAPGFTLCSRGLRARLRGSVIFARSNSATLRVSRPLTV